MIEIVNPYGALTSTSLFSPATCYGDLIFLSGQIPSSPDSGEIIGDDISSQAKQVLENVTAVLSAAGSDLSHVLKATCYITDMAHFSAFNEVYISYFTDHKPARTTIAVKQLPRDVLIEIEVIAVKSAV